jgi:hypothetical protein
MAMTGKAPMRVNKESRCMGTPPSGAGRPRIKGTTYRPEGKEAR